MDFAATRRFIEDMWQDDILPKLGEYITVPARSPAFDPEWERNGHLERAVSLLAGWATERLSGIAGAGVEIIRLAGRTSSIFINIPGDDRDGVLLYGHYDKQPEMEGWAPGKSAWTAVMEGERLYGRGGADDGYAIFSSVAAILAVAGAGESLPPIQILIEGAEESGSDDLPATFDHLGSRLSKPGLLIALDGSCGDYERFWSLTSLRGQVAGTLTVRTMREGVHSGEASGVVPSPFRIARLLLSRIEDADSGKVLPAALQASIPDERRLEAASAGEIIGPLHQAMPLANRTQPVTGNAAEQLLNRAWRPQLAITGFDGLPKVSDAAAVAWPQVALKVSIRIPPSVDPFRAGAELKRLFEADPPYSCDVSFTLDGMWAGWSAPPLKPALRELIDHASRQAFGPPAASFGGGGGIPFLSMLGERFPDVQFVVTGVLGPESNAHGPNEFLHVPAAMKLTCALAVILHEWKAN
jgi:acetylornithine deacetylase/succinyl-diaminopimelate desuccinylase-like protein